MMGRQFIIGLMVLMNFHANIHAAEIPAPADYVSPMRIISPTLRLDDAAGTQAFPPLPIINLKPVTPVVTSSTEKNDTTEAMVNSLKVSGYILNRQLVEQVARPYPSFGVVLGQGWNAFLNRQSANICIEGSVEPLRGVQQNSSISTVEDSTSYFESLSASASGSYGPFSGSGSYAKDRGYSTYDANVILNAVIDTGGEFLKPTNNNGVRLSNDALTLLKSKDGVSRFLQACGDSYVTAIREGGRMTAVLSIADVNQSQKEEIKAQAAGGFGALSANANFRKTVEAAFAVKKLRVNFEQIGGVFSGTPATLDALLEKFTQYNVDQAYNPRPYVFFTQNYRTLPNWPEGTSNRVSPVDQEYYMSSYDNFMALSMDYGRAIANPAQFLNFLTEGENAVYANHDSSMRYARNLDLIIWSCVNVFNCSTEEINRIARQDQTLSPVSDIQTNDNLFVPYTDFVELFSDTNTNEPSSETRHDATGSESEAQKGTQQVNNGTDNMELPAMSVSYYRLLAALPLYRGEGNTGFNVPLNPEGKGPDSDDKVRQAFLNWLVSSRMRPVAQRYCERASSHPLCLSEQEMKYVARSINIDLNALRTLPGPPSAPSTETQPSPPPVKIRPVPPRSHDPCERRPMLCR